MKFRPDQTTSCHAAHFSTRLCLPVSVGSGDGPPRTRDDKVRLPTRGQFTETHLTHYPEESCTMDSFFLDQQQSA